MSIFLYYRQFDSKIKVRTITPLHILKENLGIFLMGLVKIKKNMCRFGFVIFISEDYYIHGKGALGLGSNNWAELSKLFHMFHTTSYLVLRELQVFSNSSFVINWMHGILQSMNINPTQPSTQLKNITRIFH